MLARFQEVTPEGTYRRTERAADGNFHYSTMVATRCAAALVEPCGDDHGMGQFFLCCIAFFFCFDSHFYEMCETGLCFTPVLFFCSSKEWRERR